MKPYRAPTHDELMSELAKRENRQVAGFSENAPTHDEPGYF